MSRFLILSSNYLGSANANGICAKNIVKQLTAMGHEVYVVCYNQGPSEENVYTIPYNSVDVKSTFFSKVLRGTKSLFCPYYNKKLVKEYEAMALNICREKNIDTVISMYFPLETVPVMKSVKKFFPDIKRIIYELDSVGDGIYVSSFYQRVASKAFERWNKRQYRYADSIVIMESHEEYWKKKFGKKHGEKLVMADIPVLVKKELPKVCKNTDEPVSFLYGGLIEQAYRSPDYLLNVFEEYSKEEKAVIDFFSKGDCEGKIAERAKKIPGIRQNGYVPEAVLDEAVAKADVLVSIGNKFSRSVPSKLITYLSYGKPVVHFSSQKDDVCVGYLEKYPLGLVLNEWESVEENAQKLIGFTQEIKGKTVDFSYVVDALKMNTPKYSAELLDQEI